MNGETIFSSPHVDPQGDVGDGSAQEDGAKQVFVQDVAAERQIVPPVVNFLISLHDAFEARFAQDLQNLYEVQWPMLSDKYYNESPWPHVEVVGRIIGGDVQMMFLIIYKWLYYRHIYEHRLYYGVTDMIDCYTNYCNFFNYILSISMLDTGDPSSKQRSKDIELPIKWIWDIMDDFIVQFENFNELRRSKTDLVIQELESLNEKGDVWDVHSILNVLYSIIHTSRINEQIIASFEGGDPTSSAGPYGLKPLYRMLGCSSLVCLMRVHCSLGDYSLALKTVQHAEFGKKTLFGRTYMCYVTARYYLGFTYMMLRRYSDAVNIFTNLLLFASRVKFTALRRFQANELTQRFDSCYALLAICVCIMRQRIDENVNSILRDKYGDEITKMQRDTTNAVNVAGNLFIRACPAFTSPGLHYYDSSADAPINPVKYQVDCFMYEMKMQILASPIASCLRLYTVISVEKLASLLKMSVEDTLSELIVFKNRCIEKKKLVDNSQENFTLPIDINFCISKDVVYVFREKIVRRIGEWLIRNTTKLNEIILGFR